MIQDSVKSGVVPELVRAVPLVVEAHFSIHTAYPEELALEAVTIGLQVSRHELCKKKHQAQIADKLFTCAVPQRLAGIVVFRDEMINGAECAQATALLEAKKGAVSENYLPHASWQALYTQSVLKSPLWTPEPHVRGGSFDAPNNRADHRDMSRCPTVLLVKRFAGLT